MKFSLIYEAQTVDDSREGDHRIFAEIVEQALLAEEMGFDTIWAVEHTALTNYAHMSAPETFLAFIAGRTTRISIGHGVVCLPPAMNHPVKVAERIAMLDILSEGRLHFGFGKGGTQQESGTFGYDLEVLRPMIDEAMYLIPRIMVRTRSSTTGSSSTSRAARSTRSRSRTRTRRSTSRARTTSRCTTAGGRGMGALVLGFGGPDEVAKKNERRTATAFKDRDPADQVGYRPNEHLAALCPAIVLDDVRARAIGIRGQRYFMESLAYWYERRREAAAHTKWADEDLTVTQTHRRHDHPHQVGVRGHRRSTSPTRAGDAQPEPRLRHGRRLHRLRRPSPRCRRRRDAVPAARWAPCRSGPMLETIRNIGEHVIPYFRDSGSGAV